MTRTFSHTHSIDRKESARLEMPGAKAATAIHEARRHLARTDERGIEALQAIFGEEGTPIMLRLNEMIQALVHQVDQAETAVASANQQALSARSDAAIARKALRNSRARWIRRKREWEKSLSVSQGKYRALKKCITQECRTREEQKEERDVSLSSALHRGELANQTTLLPVNEAGSTAKPDPQIECIHLDRANTDAPIEESVASIEYNVPALVQQAHRRAEAADVEAKSASLEQLPHKRRTSDSAGRASHQYEPPTIAPAHSTDTMRLGEPPHHVPENVTADAMFELPPSVPIKRPRHIARGSHGRNARSIPALVVVRAQRERERMQTIKCHACEQAYRALGVEGQHTCRHRCNFQIDNNKHVNTPQGFWNVDFSDEVEQ